MFLVPGPDFAVITKNTLTGGRRRGTWSAAGVGHLQRGAGPGRGGRPRRAGTRAQPVFQAIKWAGIAYLAFLGIQALRSAWVGDHPDQTGGDAGSGWRQGFLSNITNPKVLVFYLAVLPQFLGPEAPLSALLTLALSHAVLSLLYLLVVVAALARARRLRARRNVRRGLDAATGVALIGFSTKLALE